jgi:hypothetical protein
LSATPRGADGLRKSNKPSGSVPKPIQIYSPDGQPLAEWQEEAIDRAISNGYIYAETAWPDYIIPGRSGVGDFEVSLTSYQPVRVFRKSFTGLTMDDLCAFLRDLDVKPRGSGKSGKQSEWKVRDRSLLEGGLTSIRVSGAGGKALSDDILTAIDAELFGTSVAGNSNSNNRPSDEERNERLFAYLSRGNLSDELENPELLDADSWLVHFSPAASAIAAEGFTRGTVKMSDLAFSHGSSSKKPGYNFAFLAGDEYSIRTASEYATFGGDFSRAVLFQSAAISCRFVTDNFNQAIFWGPSAGTARCLLTAEADAEENVGLEPHDWSWTVHLPDGSMYERRNLFEAIELAKANLEPVSNRLK